jgi:hypothetical protein
MAGIEFGTKYTLTGPSGAVATFNDSTDPNYIGMLTDLSGMDSPEVRENADDLVQMDGGIHGDFFYGRRPITMSGILLNPADASDRNARINKLSAASDAMRGDAVLDWTPSGGVHQFIRVRRQQPLRVSGTWQKEFQVALVAADPRIYSFALNSLTVPAAAATTDFGRAFDSGYDIDYGPAAVNGQALVTNAGTTLSYPILTITGPGSNPSISNLTTGGRVSLLYTLGVGETLVVDTLNRTVMLGGVSSRYGAIDFLNTTWWGLAPGVNDVRLAFSSFSNGASLRVDWRDAWL